MLRGRLLFILIKNPHRGAENFSTAKRGIAVRKN